MNNQKLIEEIEAINDMTDTRKVQEIREKVLWMNTADKDNNEVFNVARRKNLI